MLRSNSCDYSDAYIALKGRISVTGTNNANRRNKKLTFKNNAPFRLSTSKINNIFIDNAEDLDFVMQVYNLLECNDNYSMTSVWNYYRDEVNDSANEIIDANNFRINKNKTTRSKSFQHKTKLICSTSNNDYRLDAEVVVPLKHLSNTLYKNNWNLLCPLQKNTANKNSSVKKTKQNRLLLLSNCATCDKKKINFY